MKTGQSEISTVKPNIYYVKLMLYILWDQNGVLYYELLQPGATISAQRCRLQHMRLPNNDRNLRPDTNQQFFSMTTLGLMLQDRLNTIWKTVAGKFTLPTLLSRPCPFGPSFVSINAGHPN